ncbi:fimbrillin family protein [Bacteroides faecichinchillae]|uniref:Fimbrillin-like n=1 Tax=Bacteroides faecichinchillae TaxID=871325 RepID=A0A1M4VM50_9BACE|nr:fimbrillin family protein [Bacteroides faecichinchillae]THG66407.1 fimbrillin family protein [Bacteroides faecichinchillae]SHE70176.1 Fimbrillin-like [Bacteroides faecichinchillae]
MNIQFRLTKHFAVSALVILLLGSCSKNNIYIDVTVPNGSENNGDNGSDNNNDNGDPTKDKTLVTFSASVESRNMTRAMSPMGKGLQSWLSAYKSNTRDTINGAPVEEGDYITSSPGVLSGIQGYKMYLSNDIYSFYAVSCNTKNPAPVFTKGISEPLSNGVDYLWWSALHQDVTSSQINIPISFQHAATQVVITIDGGENITLNKIISATITPTKPGAIMDLSTGIISSETTYAQAATMGINDFTIQYIMLPLKSSDPMTLTLELLVNGENTIRTYIASVTPPDNNLKGGNSYLFRAIINENSVSFANVSVKEWTDVDESGNPIYPIQN